MIRPVKNEREYEQCLNRAYQLMQQDLTADVDAADELEVLTILIKQWEDVHYPVEKPNPVDAIRFRLEQLNEPVEVLENIIGGGIHHTEIFSGQRKLDLPMIRRLNEVLRIPAEVLIQAY